MTNPFLYTEFDVVYHNQALGYKAQPVVGTNIFSLPSPHPLFSLIPAEYSATIHLKRFTEDLGIELSSVRLREHFVRFNNVLPGSGTLICRTTLREMEDSYQHIDKDKALLVVEGESQIISKVKFLKNPMFQLNFGALKLICQPWTF